MSDTTTQHRAEDDQRPQQDETTPAPDEAPVDQQQDAQASDAEEEGGELGKVRREAAGHRKRLREVEAERDTAAAQRDVLAATVLADSLRGTGVNAELFATAGRTVDEFIVEGTLDRSAITRAGRDVAKKYGIASPAVSRYTGTGDERPPEGKTWADAIKKG